MRWRMTVTFVAPAAAVDRIRSLVGRNLARASGLLDVDITDWNITEQETDQ